jgi:hypothetical protein
MEDTEKKGISWTALRPIILFSVSAVSAWFI